MKLLRTIRMFNDTRPGSAHEPSLDGLILALSVGVLIFALALPAMAAELCFFKGERTSGMNTICFYDCISGPAAITISAAQLCPMSITRSAP